MKLKQADIWFSKCVRHSKNWTCDKCGRVYSADNAGGLDCSHIFPRTARSLRWCADNAMAHCMTCHKWYHNYPMESGVWVARHIGAGAMELLREKKNQLVKVTKTEEKEIAAHYRKEYRRMVEEGTFEFQSWQ